MDSEVYVNILDNSMLPTMWQRFGIAHFRSQHNNAPVHKVKAIASWFQDNRVDVVNWLFQMYSLLFVYPSAAPPPSTI